MGSRSGSAAELQSHHGPAPPGPAAVLLCPGRAGAGAGQATDMGWLLAPATCPQIPEEMEQHPPQPGCDRQSPQFNQCLWNHRVPVTQLNHRARAEVAAAAAVAVAISPCLQQHVGTVWGIATISGVVVPGAPCAWSSSPTLQGDRDRSVRAQPSCQAPASSAGLCLRTVPCFSPLLRWLFLLQLLMTDLRSVHTVPSLPPQHRATRNRGHCTALP